MHIVIAGGSGFVGERLQKLLIEQNHRVTILTRNPEKITQFEQVHAVNWLQKDSRPEEKLQEVDAIVNLAGESINGIRWTKEKKKKILDSRMASTKEIIRIIDQLQSKPKVLVNASAIGYYGMSEMKTFGEEVGTEADDFLAAVVRKWEEEANKAQDYGVRTVFARLGLVLGQKGALPMMLLPYSLRIGGTIGSGKQWVSWVHVEDAVQMIFFAIQNQQIKGPLNVTAPNPVRMKEFGKTISSVKHSPHWLPVPSWILKLGLGEMSNMLLKGQCVFPEKTINHGFIFKYSELNNTLLEILNSQRN
ncbi:TIGR01777 family oxidoreductase [Heyndrickxia sp. NPDC080065]|uniref:TIGR01777 family oxidoreductase n=1 Tax=Heyndrickxia sp. NPDC080065 TaxID=3390568 RepID=UPI003D0802E2